MYRVTLRAVIDVDLTKLSAHEVLRLASEYEATDESPEPDDEWLAEEWAMQQVANAQEVEVTDSHIKAS